MKYEKPIIIEEILEISDIIAVSNEGATTNGETSSLADIFNQFGTGGK